jgi:hypothetical protein
MLTIKSLCENGSYIDYLRAKKEERENRKQETALNQSTEAQLMNNLYGGGLLWSVNEDGSVSASTPTFIENTVFPAFRFNNYVFSDDGTPIYQTSSAVDSSKTLIGFEELKNIIMSNQDLKRVYPGINVNDISLNNGIILLNVRRDSGSELYRIDVIGTQILVQAALETPCDLRGTDIEYNYVSVPINSELGKKILTESNYIIKDIDKIDPAVTVFRIDQYSA